MADGKQAAGRKAGCLRGNVLVNCSCHLVVAAASLSQLSQLPQLPQLLANTAWVLASGYIRQWAQVILNYSPCNFGGEAFLELPVRNYMYITPLHVQLPTTGERSVAVA